jgi:general secretion pathway protein D
MPRQVLIEAMIAEISLDDRTQFGVDWSYSRGDGSYPTAHLLSAALDSSLGGLQYVVGQTKRWSATLTALASENKVNILSSPTVLASNDKPATINISTEVPVASAQYRYSDSSSQPVTTTNIEYRNTGIILDVTPHINESGLVSMEISQEVSEQEGEVIVAGESYPSFFQRTVNTTLTVSHNQTIVIGGLIRENRSTGKSGVPGINKIPIIGSLFGTDSESSSKTELIILITPRVIVNLNDVDLVTEGFKSKIPNAM